MSAAVEVMLRIRAKPPTPETGANRDREGLYAIEVGARAVPSAFVGEGAALYYAKGISTATGRESSRETVGSWSK